VDLGPGTKDGGIDIRVWTDKEAKAGPPIMLIQCKRTKDNVGRYAHAARACHEQCRECFRLDDRVGMTEWLAGIFL
jgi:hypothetical protein